MLLMVNGLDPTTFVAVVVLLSSIALLAAVLPARRATLVDPASVLKAD